MNLNDWVNIGLWVILAGFVLYAWSKGSFGTEAIYFETCYQELTGWNSTNTTLVLEKLGI